jgi:hypothetical protein
VANLPIEQRLLHYFLAMGAHPVEPLQSAPKGLTLLLGFEKVHVAILKNDAFLQRGKIIESIMGLSSLKGAVNQLYLAAPRLLGTTIDVEIFRSHGVGLLLFDDRRIDETVPPQSIQTVQGELRSQTPDPAFASELAELRSMYLEMERTVAKLREDLTSLKGTRTSAVSTSERISAPPIFRTEGKFARSGGDLPAFFSNNPWLEVLSRRGREEAGPLAA